MVVMSVQIKTVKTQKHLYCPVFTIRTVRLNGSYFLYLFYSVIFSAKYNNFMQIMQNKRTIKR